MMETAALLSGVAGFIQWLCMVEMELTTWEKHWMYFLGVCDVITGSLHSSAFLWILLVTCACHILPTCIQIHWYTSSSCEWLYIYIWYYKKYKHICIDTHLCVYFASLLASCHVINPPSAPAARPCWMQRSKKSGELRGMVDLKKSPFFMGKPTINHYKPTVCYGTWPWK